jgi:glycine/D-amino acid oxidase-like deaminating enzyme/nitrite reductase/ring-hydroxylating ferredoxin subunit
MDSPPTSLGHTVPLWMTTESPFKPPALDRDVEADAVVVGAGITGLTTAYALAADGHRVIVLDMGLIGGGETGRTTAHITAALDDRYTRIERLHGKDGVRLAAQSHRIAIEKIAEIVEDERIDCDFERVDGYLFQPPGDDEAHLHDELGACHRAGLHDVEHVQHIPHDFDPGPALHFPRQAQFHPMRYLWGLCAAIRRRGGEVYTGAQAQDFKSDGKSVTVTTSRGFKARGRHLVVATNTPINDRFAIHTKQAAYRTYAIALRVPARALPSVLLWDTRQSLDHPLHGPSVPYHYVRVQRGVEHDWLIVGGEDHKTGQADDPQKRWAALETWARRRFTLAGEVEFRWSGQVFEPIDAMAFIGRNPGDEDNVYIATGDSGNGMTHGTIAGILISDLIAGRPNVWEKLYDPSRKTLAAAAAYLEENLNVAVQYADLVLPGSVASTVDLKPGEGAVIRHGVHLIAAFKSVNGVVTERSAFCPHLGGVVQWNSAEHSWDCPCHGSRFAIDGSVLCGPALGPLSPATHKEYHRVS